MKPPRDIWVCPTCGANHPPGPAPPDSCAICEDERQWVPATGQRWTTMGELADSGYSCEARPVEDGLIGIGVSKMIGVGQRALLVQTPAGNLLWDPPAFIDEGAIAAVADAGGLSVLSASHPHMYGAIVEWSRAFDAEVVLPEADVTWLMRPEAPVRQWHGTLPLLGDLTLVQCGGHFPGSAALHWPGGAEGQGVLLTGDTVFVTPGKDRITFAWSAPNKLPLSPAAVEGIVDALRPYRFGRIYSGWWDTVLDREAKGVLERSAARYIELLNHTPAG